MDLVVTQEMFDKIVLENMEEFEMTTEEAIKETVEQFKVQGVNLSGICTDWMLESGSNVPTLKDAIAALTKSIEFSELSEESIGTCIKELVNIKNECEKGMQYQLLAGKNGAYDVIFNAIEKFGANEQVLKESLKTLIALMTKQPDLLDDRGVQFMIKCFGEKDVEVVSLLLKWIKECCKLHELNRQKIFDADILGKIKHVLYRDEILQDVLGVMRALVLDDDVRVEYGRAHEHARAIAGETLNIIVHLMEVNFETNESILRDLMVTLSSLLVRTEFCKVVSDAGVLKIIHEAMIYYRDSESFMKHSFKLLKSLAGNDECKWQIVKNGTAEAIVSGINRHQASATTVGLGLACVAALTLRCPDNSQIFFETGAPEAIVNAMKVHPDTENIQKNGSWAVRNMVSRSRYQNQKFLELGVEEILKRDLVRFKKFEYDMKAALRDLGCDVKLKEEWTGVGGLLNTQEKK